MAYSSTIFVIFLIGVLVIWVSWLLAHKIRPYFGKKKLASWLSTHKHQKQVQAAIKTIENVYKGSNPFTVSKIARISKNLSSDQFLYGEVNLLTLVKLLDIAQPKPGEVFYDLGSGGGRAVLMADLCYPFKRCIGIEILPALYQLADKKRQAMITMQKAKHKDFISSSQFILGDFLQYPLSDAGILFVNATAYKGRIWDNLVVKLRNLPAGCRIIVTTFELNYPEFKCLLSSHEVMSWGYCSVRIYQRIEV